MSEQDKGHSEPMEGAAMPDPSQIRLLKGIVAGLGVLIVLALAALVAGIIVKGSDLTDGGRRAGWVVSPMVQVPPDAEVAGMTLEGDRLVVHLKRPGGSGQLLVFDLRRGKLSGRIDLEGNR